jgi:beta-galactosidase/beta-glucuronidase
MRHSRSLAGTWQFQLDPDGTLAVEQLAPDREIPVPLPWQAAFPELEHYSGYAWYQRGVTLDEQELAGELLLHFGAVDYWCQVFVNGALAGEHEGGYTPFTLPIRKHVQPGENTIAVRVYDVAQTNITIPRWPDEQTSPERTAPPFNAVDIPHGKQEWYINIGGIWQDVTLTSVPYVYLDHVHVTPDIHSGAAQVAVTLAGAAPAGDGTITVRLEQNGQRVAETQLALAAGQAAYSASLHVDSPQRWSMESPTLYTATVQLSVQTMEDAITTRFGFREIATRDGRLLLNGEPIYLLSALDQDLFPETIALAPSVEYLRDEFVKARELGLNCLRCHIKPPDPRYLDLADEMGILIWAEIPSWRTFSPKPTAHPDAFAVGETIRQRVQQTLEEMIRRDFNHPSLVIWTIVNEDWGTSLPLRADDRAWVRAMYQRCKQLDPTRLVVDNSACGHAWGPNIHVQSDLDDFHVYMNIPDNADAWEQAMAQFALRPAWTYSQHGDIERSGQEPLILSEFGNWGLPSLAGLRRQHNGDDPPWFSIGAWWSPWDGEPGWPQGVDQRFKALGLDAIWPDYEAFAAATQWHQFVAMKFEIEAMRRHASIAGYVITEFADIYWESNGLLDFYRQPKVYHQQFADINAPDVIMARPARYATWDDEPIDVQLHASRYSAAAWSGAQAQWAIGADGEPQQRAVSALERGAVADLGTTEWRMPSVPQAQTVETQITVVGGDGNVLARNTVDLLALPASARQPRFTGALAMVAPGGTDSALAGALHRAGYDTATLGAAAQIAVSDAPTAELLQWVAQGGTLLYLCRGWSPFFWAQGRGGAYGGNWMSSFSWIRPDVHERLAVSSPLGLPFKNIMPTQAIVGLPWENESILRDVLAGQITGWVGHPAAHTVQFRYGQGRVIMTTFQLAEGMGSDPVATALFHDYVDYVTSDACQPTLEIQAL